MTVTQLSQLTGCLPGQWALRPWVYCLPASIFDGVLFVIVTAKSIQYTMKQEFHTPERERHIQRLYAVLFRDTVLYFGGVFAVFLGTLLMWAIGGVRVLLCNVEWSNSFTNIY